MGEISLFGQSLPRSKKASFRAKVAEMNDGTPVTIPVMAVSGHLDGPVVLLSGAIHGDEYNGPATIHALFKELEPSRIRGTVIAVPIMNPFAFFTRDRVNALDYEHMNLNRIWPGDPNGYVSQRMAYTIFEEIIRKVDYVLDYHEGGLSFIAEYLILGGTLSTKQKVGERQLQMARWFGFGLPVYNGTISDQAARLGRAGALSEAAGAIGIPVLGVELGGGCTIWPKYVDMAREGTLRVLTGLGLLPGEVADDQGQTVVTEASWPRPAHGGFLIPEPEAQLGRRVAAGTKLATVVDPFGEPVQELVAPYDSIIMDIRFVSTVYPGDWTYHCGKLQG